MPPYVSFRFIIDLLLPMRHGLPNGELSARIAVTTDDHFLKHTIMNCTFVNGSVLAIHFFRLGFSQLYVRVKFDIVQH